MRRRAFVLILVPVMQASASNPFGNGLGGAPPLGQSSIWPRDGDGPNLRPWSSPQPMPGSDPLAPMPDPVPQPVPESTQHDPSQLEQPRSQWWYLDPQTQAVQGPTSARVLVSWARSGTLPMSTLVASVDPRPVPGAPASPDNDAPLWQSLAQLVEAFGGDNGDGGEGGLSIPNPPVWQASGPEQTPDDAPVSEQALTPPGFEDASSASGVDQSSEENFGVQGSPGTSDYGQLSSDAQPVDEQTKGEATDVTAPELTEGVVGYGHPPPEMEVESKEEKLLGEPEGDPSATPEALAMHSNNAVATNPWQLPSEAQEINAGATVPMESLDTKESMEQQPSMAPVVDSSPAAPLTAADLYASYYRLSDDDDDDDGQSSSSTTARSSNNGERDLAAGTTRSERPQEHGAIDAFPDDDYLGDEYRSRKAEESSPVEAVPNEIGALQETKIAATLVETKEVATGAESFQAIATEEELPIEATPVVEEQAPSYEAVHVAESAPLEATAVEDSDMQFDSDTVNEAWNLEKDKKEQGDSDDFVPSDSQGIEEFEGGKVNEGSEGLPEASDSAAVNATSQPDSATAATDSTGAGAPSMPRAVWSERGSSLEGPHGSFEQRQVVLSLPKSLAMVVTTMKLTANQNSAVDGPEECSAEGSAEGSANEWHDKTAAAHSSTASNLPPGWQMLSDSTGRPYYANAATRESSYDPPPPAGASPTDSPSNYPLNAQQQTPPFQQHYSQAQEQAQPQQQQSLPNQEGYRYSPNDMYQQRATEQQNYGQMPQSYGAATNPYGNDPYAPYGAASYGAAPYGPPLPQPVSPYGAAPYSSFPQGPGAYRSSSARSLGSSMGPSSGLSFGRMAAGFLGAAGGRKLTFVARSTMSTVGGRTGAVFSMVRGALPIPSKSTDASISSSNAPSDTSASSPPIEDDDTDAAPLPDDDDDMDVPLSEGPRQWIEGDILSRQPPQPPPSSSEAQMLPSRQPLPPLMPPPPLQPKPKVMRPAPSGASSSSSSVLAAPGSLMKWTLNQGVQWALPGLRPLYQLAPHALMHAFKAAPAAVLLLPLLRSLAAVLHTLLPVLTVFAFAGVLPLPEAAAGTNAATVAATAKTTAENMCRWLASVSPFINQPWLLHGSDGSGRGSAADAPLALVPLAHVVALPAVVIACVALVATIANAAANALARRMHTKTEQAISARLASARADIDAVNLLNAVGPGAAESTREEAGSLMKGGKRKRSAHRWANEPSDEALLGDSAAAFHVAEAVDALAKGVAAAAAVVVAAGAVAWVARILSVTAAPGESVGEGALSAGEMLREALSTVGEASKGVGQQMSQAAGCALESGGHMLKQVPSWGWRPGEDVFSDDHGLEEALFGASGLGDDVEDAVASSVESGSGALSSSSSGSCHRLIASMSGSLLRVWPKLLITAWVVAVVVESLLLPSPPPSKAVPPVKTSPIYATGSKGSGSGAGDENEALEAAATGLVAMKRYKRRPFMDQSLTSTGSHRHSQEPQRRGPGVVMQAVHSAQHTVGASVAIVWRLLLSLVLTAADSTVIAAAVHAVATLCVGYSRTLAATKGPSSHPTSGFSMVGLELVQRIGLVGCSALLLRRGHMAVREAGQASHQLRDLEVPIARVAAASQAAASAEASFESAQRETLLDSALLISGPNPPDGLRLDNVWVSTPNKHSNQGQRVEEEEFAVRGLSLHVPGGSVCVVVGPPKSGKSALLDALAYAPGGYNESPSVHQGPPTTTSSTPLPKLPGLARGSVQLQGQLRQTWRAGPWRQAVNVMRQKPAQFPDLSLTANVNPTAAAAATDTSSSSWSSHIRDRRSMEAGVGAALALAGASHLAASTSSSYDRNSAVGSMPLSSEDWLKIGLARGVRGLVSSSVNSGGSGGGGGGAALVLLDEPLGLDHEGGNDEREVDFMSALVSAAEVQPQCAVVVATRSPKLALFANQVVVLGPKGRVLEQGDPEELLAANGYFAELLQASDEEAAPPAVQQDEAA